MSAQDSVTKEKQVPDLLGDEICARSGPTFVVVEDDDSSIYMPLTDAVSLRDWLNKVLP